MCNRAAGRRRPAPATTQESSHAGYVQGYSHVPTGTYIVYELRNHVSRQLGVMSTLEGTNFWSKVQQAYLW